MPQLNKQINARKSTRVTVAVIRGTQEYKDDLKDKIKHIQENIDPSATVEGIIEKGIHLYLEKHGISAPKNRLLGRYSEKS